MARIWVIDTMFIPKITYNIQIWKLNLEICSGEGMVQKRKKTFSVFIDILFWNDRAPVCNGNSDNT